VYILAFIALFGAHLAAAIDRTRIPHPTGRLNY